MLREAIRPRVLAAIVCAVSGIALLALVRPGTGEIPADGGGGDRWLGYALLGGAVLCEACYAVIGKHLTAVLSSRRISALMNLWGFALMLPAGAWAAWGFDFGAVSWPVWGLLLFYGLASSWTVWLWMTGLRRVPASRAGVFIVMLPVGSACVGVWMLDEPFGVSQALAFGLALAGLLLGGVAGAVRSRAGLNGAAGGLAMARAAAPRRPQAASRASSISSCTLLRPPQVLPRSSR
ncbi:hypothetical protein CDEN61S_00460 [Castellaniella denitrificans]